MIIYTYYADMRARSKVAFSHLTYNLTILYYLIISSFIVMLFGDILVLNAMARVSKLPQLNDS